MSSGEKRHRGQEMLVLFRRYDGSVSAAMALRVHEAVYRIIFYMPGIYHAGLPEISCSAAFTYLWYLCFGTSATARSCQQN